LFGVGRDLVVVLTCHGDRLGFVHQVFGEHALNDAADGNVGESMSLLRDAL
jgi:hypothetical protein